MWARTGEISISWFSSTAFVTFNQYIHDLTSIFDFLQIDPSNTDTLIRILPQIQLFCFTNTGQILNILILYLNLTHIQLLIKVRLRIAQLKQILNKQLHNPRFGIIPYHCVRLATTRRSVGKYGWIDPRADGFEQAPADGVVDVDGLAGVVEDVVEHLLFLFGAV